MNAGETLSTSSVEIIPDDFFNEDGEPYDFSADTERKGVRINPADLCDSGSPFSLAPNELYGDNKMAELAFARAQANYDALPVPEKKLTSVGAIAMTMMVQLKKEAAAKPAVVKPSPPKTRKRKRTMPTKPSTARRKPATSPAKKVEATATPKRKSSRLKRRTIDQPTKPAADFACLGIDDLSTEPSASDVVVILRLLRNNEPVEHVFSAHWVMLDENRDGDVLELDMVIDGRDSEADLPTTLQFDESSTMGVTVLADDDEISFEAIQGMFRTQFGVFHLFKFLAAFNA